MKALMLFKIPNLIFILFIFYVFCGILYGYLLHFINHILKIYRPTSKY